jgi:peptide/nickel transport system substrate-binding protein
VTRFYGDFAAAATLPASPQSPYYSEKLAKQYAYDPDKYQQLVTEANGSGKELTLLVNSADSRRIRVAHRIAEMLSAGGLRITVKALRDNSYTNALSKGNYDLHLGQTKLSSNMDLTAFFAPGGNLNFGSLSDAGIYSLCQEALANMGNYYTLHQKVMQSGMLIPILFRSYAIYTQRGLVPELDPAKDFVFYYEVIKN